MTIAVLGTVPLVGVRRIATYVPLGPHIVDGPGDLSRPDLDTGPDRAPRWAELGFVPRLVAAAPLARSGDGREWQTGAMNREAESSEPARVDVSTEAAQQRAMIAELASTLNASQVRYWLMGGWAVDAHLGRTTRQHSDIDLAVFVADRAGLVDALGTHGLVSAPGADPASEFFDGGPCRVEITYLAETTTGEVVTPGFERWPYIRGAFDATPVIVEGVEVPVLSVEALIDTKLHWQDHIGEPMRPHDRADLDALRALT